MLAHLFCIASGGMGPSLQGTGWGGQGWAFHWGAWGRHRHELIVDAPGKKNENKQIIRCAKLLGWASE